MSNYFLTLELTILVVSYMTSCAISQNNNHKECKTTELGKEYRGTLSKTQSGKTCQAWISQSPHKHQRFNPNKGTTSNYCRNPDNEPAGPWCYTTDPAKRWEYCDVKMCQVKECKITTLGREYRGILNQARSGKTCQAWKSQSPHHHNRFNPAKGTTSNYCRNPDNSPEGPWCYTTDPATRWEYCDVKMCSVRKCKRTKLGREYRGTLSQARSGKTCQAWKSQSPHRHNRYDMLSDKNTAANYCRNPDDSPEGPWCYTTDPATRWEYCDVKICPDGPNYIGCFKDSRSRDLTTYATKNTKMTSEMCIAICKKLGFKYAGLQFRWHCLCGNRVGKYGQRPDSECNVNCPGNAHEKCGGFWRNSVYATSDI
ncbi:plasminogen-like [Tubulanus polymorphus]|uniref:plasminogen-like n=1 Tax=Tubulanus polymorphus TaxID=672921 RepID=UPI003DA4EFC4